jgi:hypothetical protein
MGYKRYFMGKKIFYESVIIWDDVLFMDAVCTLFWDFKMRHWLLLEKHYYNIFLAYDFH